MDYLTILSSRSLILFPSSSSSSPLRATQLPPGSPTTTPPSLNALLPPIPISIPISSIIYADTDCAYFLLHHLLSSTGGGSVLGNTDKEVLGEAEVIVWREIDRAKLFTRALGKWFATPGIGAERKMDEKELLHLAEKYGLGMKCEEGDERGDEGRNGDDVDMEMMDEEMEKVILRDEAEGMILA
ncbi:hypothetical protein CI109_103054 [Kwoniella shandongensis]|uniref:Uncharacterized protein n=1 Tax=Kwoniella shandongensis TaxID=1734106 RepID=A0A5M6C8J1_9TREE|nr:uncharacterized protein CI109_000245 [Kwoniella shandongensis]KAA5531404.1 hypothetical protein CI109_000245 [Kwoniella shandongensis]